MKKILLVCIETEDTQRMYPAFGIMYIADALIKKGYTVKIMHDYASSNMFDEIEREAKDALLVGFTTKTSPRLKPIYEMSKRLKAANNNKIVWGGVHATLMAEDTIKNDCVDFVVMGEGELVMPKLADALLYNKDYSNIKGLAFKKDGKVIVNESNEFIKNLDDYKPRWELVDVDKYLRHNKELVLVESRGCPSRCSYCYNVSFNKRFWRGHSVDFVVNMVSELGKKHDIKSIAFYSDNFFVNKNRALEIVKRLGMPWSAEIRADYFSEDLVKVIKGTGCKRLYIGAESGSDNVLGILKKDVKVAQIENAVRLARGYGIDITCAFMVGIPGETKLDREMTLDFIHNLVDKYRVDIDGPKFLNPYPGTELYEACKRNGWNAPKDVMGWAMYSRMTYNLPFLDKNEINGVKIYQRIIALLVYLNSRGIIKKLLMPLKMLEDYRMRKKNITLPIEIYALQFLLGLKRSMR